MKMLIFEDPYPARIWQACDPVDSSIVLHSSGVYCVPTLELISWLRDFIADRSVIEIASGAGWLCRLMGIRGTDSWQNELKPAVKYGSWVEKLDYKAAVRKYRPQVVIGTWIPHKFDPAKPEMGGNMSGVDEEWVIHNCEIYINVGNEAIHPQKIIYQIPHETFYPDWLLSRSTFRGRDFIKVWSNE